MSDPDSSDPDREVPTVDDVPPTAMAVNSVDDLTRLHADPDETEVIVDAAGDLHHVEEPDDDLA
ncbi:MAG TPA: hypothetical protein VGD34_11700 [Kribbella sp.]|jgi:hypothetical protein